MKTQTTVQRWDDIVFENRNKIYGAYALRQSYPTHVLMAWLLCSGVITAIILLPSRPSVKELKETFIPATIDFVAPPTIQKVETTPKETLPVKKTTSRLVPTKVTTADVHDAVTEDITMTNFDVSDNIDGLVVENGTGNFSANESVEQVQTPPVVLFAEVMPVYEGGNAEMIKFIQKKLRYPAYAAKMGIEGTVYVSFVVSANGDITNIEIIKGIDKSCNDEAVRVISLMNRWKPGMQNKIPVSVRMVLPIKFVAGE